MNITKEQLKNVLSIKVWKLAVKIEFIIGKWLCNMLGSNIKMILSEEDKTNTLSTKKSSN